MSSTSSRTSSIHSSEYESVLNSSASSWHTAEECASDLERLKTSHHLSSKATNDAGVASTPPNSPHPSMDSTLTTPIRTSQKHNMSAAESKAYLDDFFAKLEHDRVLSRNGTSGENKDKPEKSMMASTPQTIPHTMMAGTTVGTELMHQPQFHVVQQQQFQLGQQQFQPGQHQRFPQNQYQQQQTGMQPQVFMPQNTSFNHLQPHPHLVNFAVLRMNFYRMQGWTHYATIYQNILSKPMVGWVHAQLLHMMQNQFAVDFLTFEMNFLSRVVHMGL